MSNDTNEPEEQESAESHADEALSPEDLKKVAGGLDGPDGAVLGEAGAVGEAF